jgi:hypothetical protein
VNLSVNRKNHESMTATVGRDDGLL